MLITMLTTVEDGDAVLDGEKINVTLEERMIAYVNSTIATKLVSAGAAMLGKRFYFEHEEGGQTVVTYLDDDGWSDVDVVEPET